MKHQVLKLSFIAAFFMLLGTWIFAQPTLPTTSNPPDPASWTEFIHTGTHDETIDSVTVGSRMPYRVDAQTAIPGLSFEYKWLFSPALTVQDYNGITLTGNAGYYAANEISVVMPATAGDLTITTNVRNLMGTTVLCETTDETNTIRVVPRPTIKWAANGIVTGCSAQDVTIPLTALTGSELFEIAYSIDYWDTYDKSGGLTSTSSGYVVLSGTSLNFPATTFASGNGLYEITVTDITDRISRKSLDMSLVQSQTSDLPGDAFQVLIYPSPTTNPLQHIRNMP